VSEKKAKRTSKPAAWKNTYFWISGIMLLVALIGLIFGAPVIRDPGQKREDGIVVMLYFAAAVIMLVNGVISHRQTLQAYAEEEE
jgi:hypothetical protein